MYSWIWRKLPFGIWGKLGGSFVMVGIVTALLWYIVFPWAEPILPFDDVQVGDPDGYYTDVIDPSGEPTVLPSEGDGHEIPYETDEATP